MGYEWHTKLQFIKPDLVDKVVKSLNFNTHRDSLHNSCGDTGIPVHLCPANVEKWVCATYIFTGYPRVSQLDCAFGLARLLPLLIPGSFIGQCWWFIDVHIQIYVYTYIYIWCFFCVQPKLWPMTLAKGIWVGCLGKHEWRLTMTSIRFATNSAPKWINHDQRWEGQKLCGSSSTDWRPKSYHWTLATTIQGVAHLEMLGRTCLKGICRI